MKSNYKLYVPLILLAALFVCIPGCASTSSATPTTQYTVNVYDSPSLGTFLVDSKGMTLYYNKSDAVGKSNVTAAILANWPVFYVLSYVVPTSLKASDFSSITRSDGTNQTTYRGWLLYYYVNDKLTGDALGNNVNGVWFVVNPFNFPPTVTPTVVPGNPGY